MHKPCLLCTPITHGQRSHLITFLKCCLLTGQFIEYTSNQKPIRNRTAQKSISYTDLCFQTLSPHPSSKQRCIICFINSFFTDRIVLLALNDLSDGKNGHSCDFRHSHRKIEKTASNCTLRDSGRHLWCWNGLHDEWLSG